MVVKGSYLDQDHQNPWNHGSAGDYRLSQNLGKSGGSDSRPDIKYTLRPEQKEDPEIGSYLDFVKADNPQPTVVR
jgi:hypothetical protein